MLEGERKYTKIRLSMGVTIGGDAAKSGKNTRLLVVLRVRLSQNICLLDLTNQTRFKNGNSCIMRTKSVREYSVMRLMLHARSIYYWYMNVNFLGVVPDKFARTE